MLNTFIKTGLFFLYCFFVALLNTVNAQQTIITGTVSDALTNESIPFANIAFINTTIGVASDFNGAYRIETDDPSDTLIASFIGYISVKLPVKKGTTQKINFVLSVSNNELVEISIKAGVNPADVMMEKVIENKPIHNPEKRTSISYESYNKLELDLTKISEKFKNSKIVKPFAFIFDKIDSTSTNEEAFLPFFITETISDISTNSWKCCQNKFRVSGVSVAFPV